MLLDTQYYNVNDPEPYDDTGWTLGPLRNVRTVRVKDENILKASMSLIDGPAKVVGKIDGNGSAGFVVNHTGESAIAQLRYRLPDVKFASAETAFKIGKKDFNAGTYLIKADGNSADVRSRLEKEVTALGLTATAVDKMPEVANHAVGTPRIALVHTWINTQDEGWYRVELDRLGIPYEYISDQDVSRMSDLRSKYDVVIFGPIPTNAQNIIRGNPSFGDSEAPIPWKRSELTPNFGQSPDQTDDIRGGLGIQGVANLQKFVEAGGLFITVAGNASLAIDFGMTNGVSIRDARQLKANGSVLNTVFKDRNSPIAYGYDEKLAVYFNQSPIFQVTDYTRSRFGQDGSSDRPSGRGSSSDADIVQGRKPEETPKATPTPDPTRIPPLGVQPRVVLEFAPAKELLVSGMLAGGSELGGKPVVIDVPVGKGHVVMFANNPMWRHETHGSFSLLFNAILNYDNLGVQRSEPKAKD
jgi:hypothetical protein